MTSKSYIFSKILIIGIILLFIGASIPQNISGYGIASIDKILNEEKENSPIKGNFINGYWKFDECSGDIVEDSSGHDYDGVRYGATWTTNGYSGCALDFDGVDDYVDLNSYAPNLGVNKTDDFSISFYFKTSTNKSGIIFNNIGDNNKPEVLVEMLQNGAIEFKIWTSCKCGFILTSDKGHNDGSWHYTDLYFNGISLHPTALIFIDGNLEANLTTWICPIQNINFTYATIGRKATDETDFFEGIIDEFKFIKYTGGNDQIPPTIEGPKIGKPNREYDYDFTTNDPEEDEIWIQVDWGDGQITDWLGPYNSGEKVTLSHIWEEEDNYYIKARSMDFWDDSYWSLEGYEVNIGNQPPEPPLISGPLYEDPGKELTYSFMSNDLEGQDIYYIVNWDDGSTTETDYVPSNTSIDLTHIYDFKNDYNITAKAIDVKGNESDLSDPLWIRIGDEPPRKVDIDGQINGKTGVKIDFIFTAIDPDNDKISFNIRWGDGSEILETIWYSSGEPVTFSHIWNKSGSFTIEARAKDKFDYWGDWAPFNIKIPRDRVFFSSLMNHIMQRNRFIFEVLRSLVKL
jgi:hypothetical protein